MADQSQSLTTQYAQPTVKTNSTIGIRTIAAALRSP